MMNKKLEVKNLRISFRTAGGKVQAVLGINFDLYEGETLAIVGESGSGKSVTTRAIMGISALNAITENGEIFYDGKDLLKFSEEDFQELRGNKIAMIFQDPMSSLNPIVKVGKQLTEAMLLKNRTRRKNSRKDFYSMIKKLREAVKADGSDENGEYAKLISQFVKAEKMGVSAESKYLYARKNAEEAAERLNGLLVTYQKESEPSRRAKCGGIFRYAAKCEDEFLPVFEGEEFKTLLQKLRSPAAPSEADLQRLQALLHEGLAAPVPDFYAIGYLRAFSKAGEAPQEPDKIINTAREFCKTFDADFAKASERGVLYSFRNSTQKKEQAIAHLKDMRKIFEGEWQSDSILSAAKSLAKEIDACIDPVEIRKESAERTFGSCLRSYCTRYFKGARKNKKENARYAKQTAKRERLLSKNKSIDWKVTPPALTDLDALKQSALSAIDALTALYERKTADASRFDPKTETEHIIGYLKARASETAAKVSKTSAKRRAIRLLNEVGIPDAEKRYSQYPFQLSGGQRQRIVIAIALSADPDILICDEPTTALDVTIQAQILELINKVKRERKLSVIFITHDLGVVANIADRIAVMYAGKIVEYGTAEEIFYSPAHSYTWALLSSVPDLESSGRLEAIPGTPPNMIYPPEGDAFAERNKYAMEIDFKREPPMFRITETHYAATWLLHPMAPKVEIPASVTDRIRRMKKEAENE